MSVCLASILYDPDGELFEQLESQTNKLFTIFDGVALNTSPLTFAKTKTLLEDAGATLKDRDTEEGGATTIGRFRRDALELALEAETSHIFYCDFDRVLHWLESHPEELEQHLSNLQSYDFTTFGRTARAFKSHPAPLTETEIIINNLFERVSGHSWDVLAAARGMSRRAADHIVQTSRDDAISNDASWVLLASAQNWKLDYQEVEGLEYEGAGLANDLKTEIDSWLKRLDIAKLQIEAIQAFA